MYIQVSVVVYIVRTCKSNILLNGGGGGGGCILNLAVVTQTLKSQGTFII